MSDTVIRHYDLTVTVPPDVEDQGPDAMQLHVDLGLRTAAEAAYGITADGAETLFAPMTPPAPVTDGWADAEWARRVAAAQATYPAPPAAPAQEN